MENVPGRYTVPVKRPWALFWILLILTLLYGWRLLDVIGGESTEPGMPVMMLGILLLIVGVNAGHYSWMLGVASVTLCFGGLALDVIGVHIEGAVAIGTVGVVLSGIALCLPITFRYASRGPSPMLVVDEDGFAIGDEGRLSWEGTGSLGIVRAWRTRVLRFTHRDRKKKYDLPEEFLRKGERLENLLAVCLQYRPDLAPPA